MNTESFISAYIACALWSSTDGDTGDMLDAIYTADDISPDAMAMIRDECEAFIAANTADLKDMDPAQAGHDFWLTRNGHGAGFWDRGLGQKGARLTEACRPWGSCDLYVGDDGLVHA
jgi:hypothetical protein